MLLRDLPKLSMFMIAELVWPKTQWPVLWCFRVSFEWKSAMAGYNNLRQVPLNALQAEMFRRKESTSKGN